MEEKSVQAAHRQRASFEQSKYTPLTRLLFTLQRFQEEGASSVSLSALCDLGDDGLTIGQAIAGFNSKAL